MNPETERTSVWEHGADLPVGDPASSDDSTKDVAKDQASAVKDSAVDAGKHVADVAKEQTQQVASEAGQKAQDLLAQGRTELQQQAGAQQERAAAGLHSISRELTDLADGGQDQGLVSGLAREAATRAESVASWLDHREPGEVLDGVRAFARERPAAFLALAAGAGVLTARLARGIQAGPPDSDDSSAGTVPAPAAAHAQAETQRYDDAPLSDRPVVLEADPALYPAGDGR